MDNITFKEDEQTVAGFLSADVERLGQLKQPYEGMPILQCIKTIIEDETIALNEKFVLMFDMGSVMGQQMLWNNLQQQQMTQALEGQPVQ